jgi:hypothetical protein
MSSLVVVGELILDIWRMSNEIQIWGNRRSGQGVDIVSGQEGCDY